MSEQMGNWCEFCQMTHSSMSCYHPGQQRIAELEQEVERLRSKVDEFIGKEAEGPHPDTIRLNRLVERLIHTPRLSKYGVQDDTTDDNSCLWINAELINAAIAEAQKETPARDDEK